jgi:hypothetical protein
LRYSHWKKNQQKKEPAPRGSCIVVVEDWPLEYLDVLVREDNGVAYLELGILHLLGVEIESEKTLLF